MRAAVRTSAGLMVKDMPEPIPGAGQVLARSLACGICGGDLHAFTDLDHFAELARRAKLPFCGDPTQDMVFGHEFCAEVLDHGPQTGRRFKQGARVVALPYAMGASGLELVGLSNRFPGGFAEQMVLTESLLFEVPNGLPSEHAALVEPLAVGEHAVANTPGLVPGDPVVVLGCGPVGIAVILALKRRGLGPVIASDYSAPRRIVAERVGADEIIDPALASPYVSWFALTEAGSGEAESMLTAAAFKLGKRAIAFDCVGAAGVLQKLIEEIPYYGQITVVGACSQPDRFEPMMALTKHLSIVFGSGYSAEEFEETLLNVANGVFDIGKIISNIITIDEIPEKFNNLLNDKSEMKIIVNMNI